MHEVLGLAVLQLRDSATEREGVTLCVGMPLNLGDTFPDFTADSTAGPISFHQYLGSRSAPCVVYVSYIIHAFTLAIYGYLKGMCREASVVKNHLCLSC